jgi:hypothetical protein
MTTGTRFEAGTARQCHSMPIESADSTCESRLYSMLRNPNVERNTNRPL